MYEKIWEAHLVRAAADAVPILYIDTHLVHEVTSPQAFEGLRLCPDLAFATMDHNVPTTDRSLPITDLIAAKQMETLAPSLTSGTSTVLNKASCMSSANSASRSPARLSSAVTAIPQRTVHSTQDRYQRMYSPRNVSCNRNRKLSRSELMAHCLTVLPQRTSSSRLSGISVDGGNGTVVVYRLSDPRAQHRGTDDRLQYDH